MVKVLTVKRLTLPPPVDAIVVSSNNTSTKNSSGVITQFRTMFFGGNDLLAKNEVVAAEPIEILHASLLILMNLPLLIALVTLKDLRKRKSHQLFVNILLVHIVTGFVIIISNFTENENLKIYTIVNNGLLMEMFESLILFTCERVIALKYSFKYVDVRGRHVCLTLICSWIPPLIYVSLGIAFNISENVCLIVSVVLILFAAATLGTANTIIYFIAKKHDQFLKQNASGYTRTNTSPEKTMKASYVCITVVASFVILWAPYAIHNILLLSSVYEPTKDGGLFSRIVDHVGYLHGLVDPILFIWLSRATKKEFMKMLKLIKSSESNSRASTVQDTVL